MPNKTSGCYQPCLIKKKRKEEEEEEEVNLLGIIKFHKIFSLQHIINDSLKQHDD